MKPAIEVRGLGKRYKLGLTHTDLLSEKLGNGLRSIANRFRRPINGGQVITKARQARGDSFWALKEIDFEVQPGEVMGIIGRNGAGKSTLLKILSRITSPTTGEVRLNGRVASLLEVGTGFHAELTGRENIYLNGAILGMVRSEINRKFDEIVQFAGVEKFLDTPVKRYSSGMYVRLAFAVAAHLEPEILVVDEVLAVGDAAFQKKCLNKMQDVAGQGRTVLLVSHNMVSIKRLCGRTILLEDGRLTEVGDTIQVIQQYHQRNVAQETAVVFSDAHHRTQSEFEITQLTLVNENKQPAEVVHAGRAFGFQVFIRSGIPLNNVYLALEIHLDGVNLASFWVEALSIMPDECKALVCMLEKGGLKPGIYDVHMGATDIDSGRPLDWIPEAMTFEIAESEESGPQGSHERDHGLIKIPYSWSQYSGAKACEAHLGC